MNVHYPQSKTTVVQPTAAEQLLDGYQPLEFSHSTVDSYFLNSQALEASAQSEFGIKISSSPVAQPVAPSSLLQRFWRMSFKPDLNGSEHTTLRRISWSCFLLSLSCFFSGYLWSYWVPIPHNPLGAFMALGIAGLLVLLNLRYRFVPLFSQYSLYISYIWFAWPVIFLYVAFRSGGHEVAFANCCAAIVLACLTKRWDTALIDVLLAAITAFGFAWWAMGYPPSLQPTQWVLLSSILVGGLMLNYSNNAVEVARSKYTNNVLRVTEDFFQNPLNTQLGMSQALRYEAHNLAVNPQAAEVLGKLANELDEHTLAISTGLQRLVSNAERATLFGRVHTISMAQTLQVARANLRNQNLWTEYEVAERVNIRVAHDFLFDAEALEITEAIAGTMAAMLTVPEKKQQATARPSEQELAAQGISADDAAWLFPKNSEDETEPDQPMVTVRCSIQSQRGLLQITADGVRGGHGDRVKYRLPSYARYTFKRLGIMYRIKDVREDGIPVALELVVPMTMHNFGITLDMLHSAEGRVAAA